MSVRHDPLLCRALSRELDERHAGRRVRELRLDRDRRLATLRFRSGPGLLFLLHPEVGQILETEGALGPTRLELGGLRLEAVLAPVDERLLVLELPPAGPEGTPHRLVAELHTNQWNLLLLRRAGEAEREPAGEGSGDRSDGGGSVGGGPADGDAGAWIVRAALWPREPGDRVLRSGAPYRPPAGDRRWREEAPTPEAWRDLLAGVPPGERRGAALRQVAWLSSVNVGWVLGAAGEERDDDGADDTSRGGHGAEGGRGGGQGDDALEAARRRYLELRDAEPGAWLLERSWGLQPYVRPLGEDARRQGSLRAAMAASLEAEEGWRELAGGPAPGEEEPPAPEPPELAELREALEARASRLGRRREALARELEEGPDPERLRDTGNLILARLDDVPRGREEVVLEDFDGRSRTVDLDPTLSPSENAERYYEEASRRERAQEKIPREVERTERALERVASALEGLEARDEPPGEEEADRLWELAGGRPAGGDAGAGEEERLPYRVLVTSGGLEVRVGKGAASNEELTFHHSHTEDVWLHARQVPGAHVILRWHRREGNPPRKDLLEAAVAAAVHSDARHSGSVAVDWTRRKYVRSPRKSAPGAVIPRNVNTVFVKPDEAVVKRMRRRAEGG